MSGRALAIIVLVVALLAFVGWWFGRSERCLAREPKGYWGFVGPEIDPRSHCERLDSPMFAL